jgi:hypothetical protein
LNNYLLHLDFRAGIPGWIKPPTGTWDQTVTGAE